MWPQIIAHSKGCVCVCVFVYNESNLYSAKTEFSGKFDVNAFFYLVIMACLCIICHNETIFVGCSAGSGRPAALTEMTHFTLCINFIHGMTFSQTATQTCVVISVSVIFALVWPNTLMVSWSFSCSHAIPFGCDWLNNASECAAEP